MRLARIPASPRREPLNEPRRTYPVAIRAIAELRAEMRSEALARAGEEADRATARAKKRWWE